MMVLPQDLLSQTPVLVSTRSNTIACVPAALPGLADAAPGAGAAMTELLRGAPDTDAPLAQDCLRLMAALLRACSTYRSATQPVYSSYMHTVACKVQHLCCLFEVREVWVMLACSDAIVSCQLHCHEAFCRRLETLMSLRHATLHAPPGVLLTVGMRGCQAQHGAAALPAGLGIC